MNKIKSVWAALDGKKTFIGILLASAYQFGGLVGWWTPTSDGWAVIVAIFGIGVADKVRKV